MTVCRRLALAGDVVGPGCDCRPGTCALGVMPTQRATLIDDRDAPVQETTARAANPYALYEAAVGQVDDLRKVDPDLAEWWLRLAAGDAVKTAPKTSEYGGAGGGSADLRVMGYALAELAGMHDASEAVKMEIACWFYALGKIARLISDYQQGQPGKPDTWFDLGVYTVMARRLQETGVWP